jgi:serine/threonine protein kinase
VLLHLEGSRASLAPESWLVAEFLDDHESIAAHVARVGASGAAATLQRLARDLAFLHDEGLSHRDLKAENLLVPRAGGRALLIEADGVRRFEVAPLERAARDLMRLNASFPERGTVTWRDRARFLIAWRRARRIDRPPLREVWSAVATLTAIKWTRRATTPAAH